MMADTEPTDTHEPRPDAFEVDFECRNCGDEWSHSYPPNTCVDDSTTQKGVTVHDTDEFGKTSYVDCPTCELTRAVTVDGRNPLGDDDG